MKKAIQQLRNNLSAFVLALLLAFVIWIAASLRTDPFANRRVSGVPLQVVHQLDNTVTLDPVVEQIAVTARARESVLAGLRAASFRATLDLSGVRPGEPATVPITVTCSEGQVRIESFEPSVQVVRLAALQTITRAVTIQVKGRVATGYEPTRPILVPEQITIRGPEPSLSEVVSVTASVNVEGAKKNVIETVSVQLLDSGGRPVPGLQPVPQEIRVEVPVRSLAEYKPDVNVVPDVRGEPGQGYRKGNVLVRPSTVTLEGSSTVLDKLPDFVETMPITITGATETLSRRTPLTVPADVNVVEVSYVTVTVEILPILSTRPITGTVELLRVPPGVKAIPDPSVVTVTLEGPDAKLAGLRAGDLLIVLDLRGYTRGIYQIKPEVLAPVGVRVLGVDPETIEVVIELLPTPTPILTPQPTPIPSL